MGFGWMRRGCRIPLAGGLYLGKTGLDTIHTLTDTRRMGRSSIQLLLLLAVAAAIGHAFLAPTGTVHRQRHRTTTRMQHQQGRASQQQQQQQPPQQDRRGALATGVKTSAVLGALGLGFGLKGPAKPTFAAVPAVGAAAATPKTIVITGANSGIGLDAATKLAARGHKVYVACRTQAKADATAQATGAAGAFECDLSSLESVRRFVDAWGGAPIDVLCLNAGVAMGTGDKAPKFTQEGFEETIGVNHLGHFYLAQRLLGNLEKSSLPHPRLVVTASSVHDPDTPGGNVGPGATLGELKGFVDFLDTGARFQMVDGAPYNPDKAYKDSKLCNVLFTEEMGRRLAARGSKVTCNCFSPGLIPSTGLFRSQNPVFVALFNFIAVQVLGVGTTQAVGGDTLVYMAESPELEDTLGKFYATPPGQPRALFGEQQVSREAQDAEKAKRFWELSEKLLEKVTKA